MSVAMEDTGWNQLLICLHSHLRDKDKKVKNENYDALLLKAFTVTVTTECGARKDVFWMIKNNS